MRLKMVIIFLGLTSMLTIMILWLLTFFAAYADPTKSILVDINTIGEANVEAILAPIMAILSIAALVLLARGK